MSFIRFRPCSFGSLTAAAAAATLTASAFPAVAAAVNPPQKIVTPTERVVVSETYLARVEKVMDGDTLLVQPDNREEKKRTVHLFGIAAPKGTDPQAKNARDFLKNSAQGKRVRVETRRRNSDGTMEARVTLLPPPPPRAPLHMEPSGIRSDMPRGTEGVPVGMASSALLLPETERNLNYGLLRAGLARLDANQAQSDGALYAQLSHAEESAQQDKVGLWSAPPQSPPSAPAKNRP